LLFLTGSFCLGYILYLIITDFNWERYNHIK
jgi:hypothetical protein